MRNPQGYATIISPMRSAAKLGGLHCEEVREGVSEYDTFTCFHCNRVTHVKPRMDPADLGGMCKICYKLICARCVDKGCDPFEEKLKRAEARQEALRSYG